VLDRLGVEYWADFGTLLGMYREKDIIKHDNDVDVVVLDPDWDTLLAALKQALPQFRVRRGPRPAAVLLPGFAFWILEGPLPLCNCI
jgi:phosphorylcholine metabolism protein LicD